ncbi:MAG: enoyl-CoA hydratase/isomerase family protein [Dehalococcoidia bacterium]
MSDQILVECQPPVATIILNRPRQRNAISYAMWGELAGILTTLEADSGVRAIVITGAGEQAFSAGADIQDFDEYRSDAAQGRVYNAAVDELLDTLSEMSTPTISMIRGFAAGGGCELAVATDLRIAAEGSRLGIPAARMGIGLGHREMQGLVNLVGKGNALYMLLSGRLVEAQEAWRMGLVNQVVPAAELQAYTYQLAEEIAGLAPLSHTIHKRIINQVLAKPSLADLTPEEADLRMTQYHSKDYQEGYRAFLEKRRPNFIGE